VQNNNSLYCTIRQKEYFTTVSSFEFQVSCALCRLNFFFNTNRRDKLLIFVALRLSRYLFTGLYIKFEIHFTLIYIFLTKWNLLYWGKNMHFPPFYPLSIISFPNMLFGNIFAPGSNRKIYTLVTFK